MAEIKFLGTAGARFVVAKQLRYSAGTLIRSEEASVILDPGPGTLLRLASSRPKVDPESLDGIILTHIHLDHSTDTNVLIDSFTKGGLKKYGILFAPNEALIGDNRVILPFLIPFLDGVHVLKHGESYTYRDISFTAFRHKHSAETYGIKMKFKEGIVSFIVDTLFFPELIDYYVGSDIIVINVVRLKPQENLMHLSIDDVKKLIYGIKPKKAVLTHFGMTMLKAKPFEIAKKLSKELGITVIAATDGMTIKI
jgi:phosphoribosyl 1,2-cyclic phosphodiesterase